MKIPCPHCQKPIYPDPGRCPHCNGAITDKAIEAAKLDKQRSERIRAELIAIGVNPDDSPEDETP